MLLDPSAGTAVLVGPDLARMLGGEPGVQQELMRFQVETATGVCASLDDLGRELARLRRLAADAAASLGCRLLASGIAPYRAPGLAAMRDHSPATEPPRPRVAHRRHPRRRADQILSLTSMDRWPRAAQSRCRRRGHDDHRSSAAA